MPPYYMPSSVEFLKNNFLSWRIGISGTSIRDMTVFKNELYVGGLGGVIYVLNSVFDVVRTITLAGNDIEKIISNDTYIFVATTGANKIFRSGNGTIFTDMYTHGGTIRSGACSNSNIMFVIAATANNYVYSIDNGDTWTKITLDINNSLYWNSCIYVPETNKFIVARGGAGYKIGDNAAEIIANPIIPTPVALAGAQFKSWGFDGTRYYGGTTYGTIFHTTTPAVGASWVQNQSYIRGILQCEIEDFVRLNNDVYGIDSLGNVFKIKNNIVNVLPNSSIYQPLSMCVFNGEVIYGDLSNGYLRKTLKGNDL